MTSGPTVESLEVPHPDEIFIAGTWRKPQKDTRVTVVNPSTEEIIGTMADPAPGDVDLAVAAARTAFDSGVWPTLSVDERIEHLRPFVEGIKARMDPLNSAWAAECGATLAWREAVHGIAAPMMFQASFDIAASTPLSEVRDGAFGRAEICREPFGVAVAIITYNGPLTYVAFKVLPALLAGNVVILKTPPETRMVAQFIAEAAEAADLPPGVLSVITAGSETSRYLVEHPGVDTVSFTGGTSVGAQIAHCTADRMLKLTLELGGKCAGIVADDIPIDELIPAVLPGLLAFQGQVCVALTRLLVTRKRHEEVLDALVDAFRSVRIGNASSPDTTFGPVAVERTRSRCETFTQQALADGAKLACGGQRPQHLERGWFLEPTLLTNVDNSMNIARTEVFGPVFTIIEYDDMDDAVRIANDSPFGLSGAIFTNDQDLSHDVARRVRVGSFTTNSCGGVPGHPFGGYKMSGLGREMGPDGYLEWFETKAIGLPNRQQFMSA